ncbi:MAG TPA: glycosyltransferase family 39 protein, partial [Lacibacter sp.]|nr:glycosyltransferase family 39 protein [Lacibacter sp.]
MTAIAALALRTIHYAGTSSMWYDELTCALNVTEKSYYQLLTQPLDFNQVASIGFLLITKLSVSIFGEHDFAFRLWPWLCTVTSVYFFYQIARNFLKDTALLAAFILFAFSASGWFYAGQAKQYAGDIASSLFLIWATLQFYSHKINLSKTLLLSIGGFVFISASMPAVALAGVLLCFLLIQFLFKTNQNSFRSFFILGFIWAIACAWVTYHAKFILDTGSVDAMSAYWSRGFIPLTGLSDALLWLIKKIRDELGYFIYFFLGDLWPAMTLFATVLFTLAIAGIIKLFATVKAKTFILLSPFFLAIVLSLLRILPYDTRVALYASWPLLIAAAYGAEWLSNMTLRKIHPSIAKAFILFIALPMPVIHLIEPNERPPFHCQPAQPVLKELKKRL